MNSSIVRVEWPMVQIRTIQLKDVLAFSRIERLLERRSQTAESDRVRLPPGEQMGSGRRGDLAMAPSPSRLLQAGAHPCILFVWHFGEAPKGAGEAPALPERRL